MDSNDAFFVTFFFSPSRSLSLSLSLSLTKKNSFFVSTLGGCDGAWMRFAPDMDVPQNGGTIKAAREGLDKLKKDNKAFSCITHADLYTLAASVATELAGGPAIGWSPGRIDAMGPGPAHPPLSSALPDGMMTGAADAAFFTRWGFTVREAVAILGGTKIFSFFFLVFFFLGRERRERKKNSLGNKTQKLRSLQKKKKKKAATPSAAPTPPSAAGACPSPPPATASPSPRTSTSST